MGAFNGTLNSNEIYASLYNLIISQQTFAENIKGVNALVDRARVDGSLYGDQKLYYATDVLKSAVWGNDAEATNLLALHRPAAPSVQAIVLNKFRQISLTLDDYLSKRAWGNENSFAQFTSVMMGWIGETKRVYDATTYNAFIGTDETATGDQTRTLALSTILSGLSGEEKARVEGQSIARDLADLLVNLTDISRDYNDYGYLRSYEDGEIKVIWNAAWLNKIAKLDLPTIFHKDVMDKFEDKLPPRYFGTVITSTNVSTYSASTPAAGKPIDSDTSVYTPGAGNVNGTLRSLIERDFTISGTNYHVFAGDEIPAGAKVGSTAAVDTAAYGEFYIEDANVMYKVIVKYPPYMSAFEVGTSFFNPKSLTENHYLTWGHNTLEHLKGYPMITVKAA